MLRVPNTAITLIDRRVHWVEADTRQAFVEAAIAGPSRIDITARWTRTLTLYLHDRLVNLDRPIDVWVNGVKAFSRNVPRSALRPARSSFSQAFPTAGPNAAASGMGAKDSAKSGGAGWNSPRDSDSLRQSIPARQPCRAFSTLSMTQAA